MTDVQERPAAVKRSRAGLSTGAKRGIWVGAIVALLLVIGFGTKVVAADDPILMGAEEFDAVTYGPENFGAVQAGIAERAVDAGTLAEAIAADPDAASSEYAVESSGGPVFSVTFTGVVGEGQSGIYAVAVDGVPENVLIRMQTGPAINGTELRDATGEIAFGQFTNQIDYQDAASSLNDEMKVEVLADVDTANLQGQTVTVTGAFTLVNPEGWLVTPSELEVG